MLLAGCAVIDGLSMDPGRGIDQTYENKVRRLEVGRALLAKETDPWKRRGIEGVIEGIERRMKQAEEEEKIDPNVRLAKLQREYELASVFDKAAIEEKMDNIKRKMKQQQKQQQ